MRWLWRIRPHQGVHGVYGLSKIKMIEIILQRTAEEMSNPDVKIIVIRRYPGGWEARYETRQPLSWWLKFWKFWQFREP